MLNLSNVATQMGIMVELLKAGSEDKSTRLNKALGLIENQSLDIAELQEKSAKSQKYSPFLLAGPLEPLSTHIAPIAVPADFSVIATDGSQIDVDRHQSTHCFLINIGRVRLDYGQNAAAQLDSLPQLYANEKDTIISSGHQEQRIEGLLLGLKRSIEECRHLSEMATELPSTQPAIAIMDGSLIMWQLSNNEFPDFVVKELLDNGFMKYLNDMQELSRRNILTMASYISFPRSVNVANTLRLSLCPYKLADCIRYCRYEHVGQRHCDGISGVQDRDLFTNILHTGERSAVFISQAKIVMEKYGEHTVHFFYLKLEDEVARVEIPQWVACDPLKLNMAHAMIYDQCQRGNGYPIALAESHEQAVVSNSDKENFQQLLMTWLADEHINYTSSAKNHSKKTRWV